MKYARIYLLVCGAKSHCKGSVKDTWFDVVAIAVIWACYSRGGDFAPIQTVLGMHELDPQ